MVSQAPTGPKQRAPGRRSRAPWPVLRRCLTLAGFFVLCSWGASAAHADDHTGPVDGLVDGVRRAVTTGTVSQVLDDTVGVMATVPGARTSGGGGSTDSRLQATVRHAVRNVDTVVDDVDATTAPVTSSVIQTVHRTVDTVLPPTGSRPPTQQPPAGEGSLSGHQPPAVAPAAGHAPPGTATHRSTRTHAAARAAVLSLGAPRPDHVPAVQLTRAAVVPAGGDDPSVHATARARAHAPSAPDEPGPFAPLPQVPAAPSLLLSSASASLGILVEIVGLALATGTVVRRTRRSLLVPLGPAFRPALSPG